MLEFRVRGIEQRTARRLAREEGILAGTSSGAAAAVALRLAADLGPGKLVATIFPDTGERYFSMAEWFPAPEARP